MIQFMMENIGSFLWIIPQMFYTKDHCIRKLSKHSFCFFIVIIMMWFWVLEYSFTVQTQKRNFVWIVNYFMRKQYFIVCVVQVNKQVKKNPAILYENFKNLYFLIVFKLNVVVVEKFNQVTVSTSLISMVASVKNVNAGLTIQNVSPHIYYKRVAIIINAKNAEFLTMWKTRRNIYVVKNIVIYAFVTTMPLMVVIFNQSTTNLKKFHPNVLLFSILRYVF